MHTPRDPIQITIPTTIPTTLIRVGIRAMGILAIRDMGIRARGRAMGIHTAHKFTWGHLRRARMATMTITPMLACPTATTDLAGSQAESLLASGRGDMAIVASMAAVATTETGGALPGAEDSAVE